MSKLNVGVVLGILLIASTAWSSPLFLNVNNPSFENPGVLTIPGVINNVGGKGAFAYNTIFGWTVSQNSTGGTYSPNPANDPFSLNATATGTHVASGANGVPGGTQVAFLTTGATMFQDLVALNSFGSFTLTVDVGRRTDVVDPTTPYTIALMTSGGSTLKTLSGTLADLDSGFFSARTLTYTGATPVNQSLRVEFSAGGLIAFDNVSVLNNAPEIGGSAVFWTMFGVAGLFIYGKKRLAA
jgi:hypothetical protein